jgi:hypothetical protein
LLFLCKEKDHQLAKYISKPKKSINHIKKLTELVTNLKLDIKVHTRFTQAVKYNYAGHVAIQRFLSYMN